MQTKLGDCRAEGELGKAEEDEGDTDGDGRDLTCGGERTVQYTDDVL